MADPTLLTVVSVEGVPIERAFLFVYVVYPIVSFISFRYRRLESNPGLTGRIVDSPVNENIPCGI